MAGKIIEINQVDYEKEVLSAKAAPVILLYIRF